MTTTKNLKAWKQSLLTRERNGEHVPGAEWDALVDAQVEAARKDGCTYRLTHFNGAVEVTDLRPDEEEEGERRYAGMERWSPFFQRWEDMYVRD